MIQYVIGNDIDQIYWDIFSKQEVPEKMDLATDIVLFARHAVMKTVKVAVHYDIDELATNRLKISIQAESIIRTGVYDLELTFKKIDDSLPDGERAVRTTSCSAFEVVSCSSEVKVPTDPLVIAGIIGPLKGLDAYEAAVKNGFTGTEEEWLQSLKQPALDAAETANAAVENMTYSTEISEIEYNEITL